MAGELSAFAARLGRITDPASLARIARATADAAAEAARQAAAQDLGGDRRMSRLKGARGLDAQVSGAGAEQAVVYEPAGEWMLAQNGRRSARPAVARPGSALRTPWGPRASVRGSTSRGLNTVDHANRNAADKAPRAGAEQWHHEIARVLS